MWVGIGVRIGQNRFATSVGVLDLFPNASVAYSLRLLRSAYTGSAIRVRRSSDNTEQNIGFNSLGDLDTTALDTFCSGTNGFVTTWYDQSGNGNNLTQTTAANQPQIVSSGSVILQNTKPTIQTDGNDFIETTALNIYASANNLSSFQVVTDLTNTTANDFVFGVTSGSYGGGDNNIILRKNSTQFDAIVNNGIISATATHTRDTNQNLLSFIYRGGIDLTFWKNSATNVNSTVASSVNATKELEVASALNATLAGSWYLQEKIDWKTDQTANASDIRTNMANYWGITL
tara:strand:- start:268 stop:1134 length:867 start_codon:yes stop_codon:yes gene_type:complete